MEYRPPEEVFAPESLASFANAPVTIGHVVSEVTPENWRKVSVGHLASAAQDEQDKDWVSGPLTIADHMAIERALDKDRPFRACSVGYKCRVVPQEGISPDGKRYTHIQRDIRANHIALLPEGEERQAGASLRLDSKDDQVLPTQPREKYMRKYNLNGVVFDVDSDAFVQALDQHLGKTGGELETLRADSKSGAETLSKLEAERDALKDENAKLKAEAKANETRLDAKDIDAEIAFRDAVRPALPSGYDFTGKSRHQVRLDALQGLGVEVPEAKREDESYVEARLDAVDAPAAAGDDKSGGRPLKQSTQKSNSGPVVWGASKRAELAKQVTQGVS